MWRQLQMKDGKVTQLRREELERSHHLKKMGSWNAASFLSFFLRGG